MRHHAASKSSGTRQSALWGKGGRGKLVGVVLALTLLVPAAATAAPARSVAKAPAVPTYLPGSLLADAKANPGKKFKVILELKRTADKADVTTRVKGLGFLKRKFAAINGMSAELPGAAITFLAQRTDLLAITRDVQVRKTNFAPAQVWPASIGADTLWPSTAVTCPVNALTGFQLDLACVPTLALTPPKPPTIAIVDSGIDASRVADFGGRVVANVGLSQLAPGVADDGAGHGTFVASIAAGGSHTHPGAAPTADLVNLRVMDDHGMAMTSDIIAAADWILQHKAEYGIKVANFSLLSAAANSFKFDPLDHAVERLWFAGVTVVTAAGNQGNGTRLPMVFAPANDPFVITVGAAWTHDTVTTADDDVAPFSAYGHTADGFAKPELVAPGRYMTGAVSPGASLYTERADRIVEPGYMNLSGTSFASPVVAAAAAQLLAAHPGWTPDQVKGALMATASPLPLVSDPVATGVGEIDLAAAHALVNPPNPNAGLQQFVVTDPTALGGKAFDSVSWESAAQANVSWDSVSWESVSWESVSWESVSWESVSWESVSWESVSWAETSLANVSWSEAAGTN
jgi:serine protease AprX